MPYFRTRILILGALALAVVGGVIWSASRGAAPPPAPLRSRPAALPATPASPGRRQASATDRLQAVRTVAQYCRLLENRQVARAQRLCLGTRIWPRRVPRGVTRLRLRCARVYAAPDARTLVFKARVRVRAVRGCPLPSGLVVRFFTLGKAAGDSAGGWRITAVSADP